MRENTSQHILNTSANLLGFCLFVITSLHITNGAQMSHIDEFTSIIAILLILSCLFSFLSIRTRNADRKQKFETIANYIFISSLTGILFIILFMAFKLIK